MSHLTPRGVATTQWCCSDFHKTKCFNLSTYIPEANLDQTIRFGIPMKVPLYPLQYGVVPSRSGVEDAPITTRPIPIPFRSLRSEEVHMSESLTWILFERLNHTAAKSYLVESLTCSSSDPFYFWPRLPLRRRRDEAAGAESTCNHVALFVRC